MTLWTGATIGSPGSIPFSARIGISVSPNLVEVLLGPPDIEDLEVVAIAEADVERAGRRGPGAGLLKRCVDLLVLRRVERTRVEVHRDGHSSSPPWSGSARAYQRTGSPVRACCNFSNRKSGASDMKAHQLGKESSLERTERGC